MDLGALVEEFPWDPDWLLSGRAKYTYMIDSTNFSLKITNSTSGGKSPGLTTSRLVSARGSEGQGAILNLWISKRESGHAHNPRPDVTCWGWY